jgi:hypothetical protein
MERSLNTIQESSLLLVKGNLLADSTQLALVVLLRLATVVLSQVRPLLIRHAFQQSDLYLDFGLSCFQFVLAMFDTEAEGGGLLDNRVLCQEPEIHFLWFLNP